VDEVRECRASGGLIADAVRRWSSISPDAVAFRGGDGASMTFGELPEATARVARALADRGLRPGERVALMEGRGRHALSALFGTWAAGASAVLLDERHPAARRRQIVSDAGCRILVSGDPAAAELGLATVDPADERAAASDPGQSPVWTPRSPDDEAYVVYTSGTTGSPKGVRVGTANVENFLAAAAELRYRAGSVAAVVVSPGFDGWLWSVLTPFVHGATCVTLDPQAGPLAPQIATCGATNLSMTPTLYSSLDQIPELELAVVAGERCPEPLIARLRSAAARVINVYGPTEATIAATMADTARGDDPACIGRPLHGCRVEVVDAALRSVPADVEGEILIGGAGVSLGYADGRYRQASAFVTRDGERYYRSGDIGVVRADSQLECRGRLDEQVKVAGFRLEYAEVEVLARTLPEVRDAVAYLRGTPPTVAVAVVADVEPAERDRITARLRTAFAENLPRQLCPTLIRFIAAAPVDPTTGKIARRTVEQLPDPHADAYAGDPPSGGTDVRAHVHNAWLSAFGRPVDDDADFFELGGHSLLAAQLANEIGSRIGMPVSAADVLLQPTPAKQVAIIGARRQP